MMIPPRIQAMTAGKKYSFSVEKNDAEWAVSILRRASSRKTVVSKRQAGFASEEEATAWGESELKSFQQQQAERNKRKAKDRN
jgi:hypothetical protein